MLGTPRCEATLLARVIRQDALVAPPCKLSEYGGEITLRLDINHIVGLVAPLIKGLPLIQFLESPGPAIPIRVIGECDPDSTIATSPHEDRKSTRLNSSHSQISYAVFCLKK